MLESARDRELALPLNIARLPDHEVGILIVSERAQKCRWNLAVAFVIDGGKEAVVHDDSAHGSMLTGERASYYLPHVRSARPL
jgi:hypothetical protein